MIEQQLKHYKNIRRFVFATVSLILLSLNFYGCDVRGLFFTHLEDDPKWENPNPPAPAGSVAAHPGKSVYSKICQACHGSEGKGLAGAYPPLGGSEFASSADETLPIRIVLHGFKGPITRGGAPFNGAMVAWKDQLSDQQVADVLTYVRISFGNSAGAITPEKVKEVRDGTIGHSPYAEAELQQPL